jgi:hypothetical protein
MEARHFDLQSGIRNYLSKLHLDGNLSRNDEMELESHIRDGVDSLAKTGLSEEEAFLITVKRTGHATILSEEYNKVNPFFVSNKIRSYSIISLGLILSLGTIFLFLYDVIDMFRGAYLAQTTADTIVKVFLYLGLCVAILTVLKWGKSFTLFLQNKIDRNPFATAATLFLLPLMSFGLQSILIRYIDRSDKQEYFNSGLYDTHDVQYVNFSFYLLVISALFATLIWLDTTLRKTSPSGKSSFLKSPVCFLIFFCLVICLAAGMTRYLHQVNSGFQSSIFFAIVFTMGSFSIALYNNDHLWSKLFIFSLFGLFLGNLLIV